jgi:hypothetical protein
MVEVFKTNVNDKDLAFAMIELIHKTFDGYRANFDLEDCDRILRIESHQNDIEPSMIIGLLSDYGFQAQILDDMLLEPTTR